MQSSFRRSNNSHSLTKPNRTSTSRTYDDMAFADLYTRPTESESFEDPEEESSMGSDSEGIDLQIPSGYRSPTSKKSFSPLSTGRPTSSMPMKMAGINDEDRLLMLAKHPNATDEQVVQTLFRQQQVKAARQKQKEQQLRQLQEKRQPREPNHQVTFSPAYPVDADTGEAWDRQAKPQRWSSSSANTSMTSHASSTAGGNTDSSFDRAWASDEVGAGEFSPVKQSFFAKFWRRVVPITLIGGGTAERDDSVVSRQDASVSISMASDKTPKISNVDEKARAKRIRQQLGYLSWGDRWEQFQYKMFRTRQGLLVLGLLLILIVAIVVTIITALAAQSDDKSIDSSQSGGNPRLPGGTLIPRPEQDDFMTLRPSFSPTTDLDSPPTEKPSTSSPTITPTLKPSLRPTTLSPTAPDATRSPTRRPTPSPTARPTLSPTMSPSPRPSLRPVKPPTTPPTLSTQPPSATFLASPPLRAVGASLVGNQPDQRFGQALAASSDGRVIAVGAPSATIDGFTQAGMVQVFQWTGENGGTWQPRGLPLVGRGEGDQFGSAVALSADGSILVASEPMYNGESGYRSGNVRAFIYSSDVPNSPGGGAYRALGQEMPGSSASDHFGLSISLSGNGQRLVVGAPYHDNGGPSRNVSGQVMVFDFQPSDTPTGGTWLPIATMAGTDHLDWFGWKVDLEKSGRHMCVGAPRNLEYGGYVQCYDLNTNTVMGERISNNIAPMRYDDNFGHSLKVTRTSARIKVAIGSPGKNDKALDAGMAVVYEYDLSNNEWSVIGQPIVAASPIAKDELGFSVDLLDDILVLGSPGRAQVDRYILVTDDSEQSSQRWEPHPAPLTGAAGSSFGYVALLRENRLVVGIPEMVGENTGMVNMFQQ